MTMDKNEGDGGESLRLLRARLEAAAARDRNAEQMAAKTVLMHFPRHYQGVISGLAKAGLLPTTAIDYVDHELRSIEFAWPEKMIGLRVTSWPLPAGTGRIIPDFVYNDAALRERGWLILPVDPCSRNFQEQLDRVVSVVERARRYRGPEK